MFAYLDMPTLGQPEAFVQWNDELVTAAGDVGEHSHDVLDAWLGDFLKPVETHSA